MSSAPTNSYVLLLRGINVGRNKRLAMPDLRSLLEDVGYSEVRTHLQSGNVVLTSPDSAARIAEIVRSEIAARLALEVGIIVRTADEMAEVVSVNALRDVATDPSRYVVTFLPGPVDQTSLRELEEQSFAPEEFAVRGREVFLWCPNGQHESPLAKALGKAGVTTTGTARNWRTVTRLAELAAQR